MRYLKKFNEGWFSGKGSLQSEAEEKYGEFATEVRDFSETHLAYLLDDYKFQLKVGTYPYNVDNDHNYGLGTEGISSIVIESNDSDGENLPFQWEEISDNFIPFFTLLSRRYKIEEFRINNTESFQPGKIESDYYTVSQVINNQVTTKDCEEIIIKVSRKKEGTLQKIKSFFK
jgi:hypothetical protein